MGLFDSQQACGTRKPRLKSNIETIIIHKTHHEGNTHHPEREGVVNKWADLTSKSAQ